MIETPLSPMEEGGDPRLDEPVVEMVDPELEAMKAEQAKINAALSEKYGELEATIETLQADVQTLHAGQSVFQKNVTALTGRVEGVENSVVTLEERMTSRFDNFDAAIAKIREEIRAAQETMEAQKAAEPPAMEPMDAEGAEPERDIEAEIALMVDRWRQAWQAGDIDAYMQTYDAEASITRISVIDNGRGRKVELNPVTLERRMRVLMQKYDRMQIVVIGFRVIEEGGTFIATFQQEFSSWANPRDLRPIYTDSGVKTLVFSEESGDWRIVRESWIPVQRL